MELVERKVLSMTPEEISALPPLTDHDFYVIGALIQTYNFVDLNVRRALEIFGASSLTSKKNLMSAGDFDVLRAAKHVIVENKIPTVGLMDANLAFEILEYGKQFRNLAAHGAGKGFPTENVIVFASRNDRDAKQTIGKKLDLQRVTLAVMDRRIFINLVQETVRCSDWLASQVPYWSDRYLPKA